MQGVEELERFVGHEVNVLREREVEYRHVGRDNENGGS